MKEMKEMKRNERNGFRRGLAQPHFSIPSFPFLSFLSFPSFLSFLPFLSFLSFLSFLFVSCDADNEYSTWYCSFAYDNMVHTDPALASATNARSRGVFCYIWESTNGGQRYNFSNNHGLTSSQPLTEAEKRAQFVLGLHNGIIVGYQTFITEVEDPIYKGFIAYDAQCPNCVRRENNTINPRFVVSMDASGIATCAKCGKRYDMNNGGLILNAEENDKGLEKYGATTTGPYGYITVHTKR